MLRVVVDTNSLVSYVLTQGDLMRRVVAHWRAGTFTLVHGLERFSDHVPGALFFSGACRDPKDDKFLACAVEGGAHYLVSSDRDLLDMRCYHDVAIANPGQFLLALELYPMEAAAIVARFSRDVLEGIQASVPLEPETASRVAEAVAMLSDERVASGDPSRKSPVNGQ